MNPMFYISDVKGHGYVKVKSTYLEEDDDNTDVIIKIQQGTNPGGDAPLITLPPIVIDMDGHNHIHITFTTAQGINLKFRLS